MAEADEAEEEAEEEAETVAVGGVQVRSPAGYLVNSSVKLAEDEEELAEDEEALPVVLEPVLAVVEVVAFEETVDDVVAAAVVFDVAAADVDVILAEVDFAEVVFPTATFGAGSRSKSKPLSAGPASKGARPITLESTHISVDFSFLSVVVITLLTQCSLWAPQVLSRGTPKQPGPRKGWSIAF